MSKRKFSGRYLPLALGAAQLAYRTMGGRPVELVMLEGLLLEKYVVILLEQLDL